jgi:hypothetical protein
MQPRTIHKAARLVTIAITVAAAAFGSLVGVSTSMWGGIFVTVPVTTAIFTLGGAVLGRTIQLGLMMKWPED